MVLVACSSYVHSKDILHIKLHLMSLNTSRRKQEDKKKTKKDAD